MKKPLRVVILGLSITSSWGNGHATTYRALVRGLHALGHEVTFLERDVAWYRDNRDERHPEGCRVELYSSVSELRDEHQELVRNADAVIVGSYVPDGADVVRWALGTARGLRLFYDIDTPITLGQLRRGEATYIDRASLPELDGYLSFTGGAALIALEREFGVRRALPLYCSVDAARHAPQSATAYRDLGYLGTYSADREEALERLLIEPARRRPNSRFIVAGPCYPAKDWPSNVERIEHVPPADHSAFYTSLRFTLNLTRADMVQCGHAPSVRLFEAAACAVPIISDIWPGIEEFFEPETEILLARTAEDVLSYVYDTSEAERRRIGARARSRVLREHTGLRRAEELQQYLFELEAARAAA